jgi:glycosyltransferase involved in cell wall biosynthesis
MILFAIFCLVIFIQIFFYLYIFKNLKRCNSAVDPAFASPVSVVVCAKNEADNLKMLLPALAEQSYPSFELLLVNDFSQDNTLKVMQDFRSEQKKYGRQLEINIIDIPENESSGKKHALTRGILNAGHEFILLTDADCIPATAHWLRGMANKFTEEKTIVLGYGPYRKINASFLNKLIRYETLLTALQYFSYAKMGQAYMGVGRNLAYKKSVFIKTNGFQEHAGIASGDDDLFVSQAATAKNTALCAEPETFMYSQPKTSFGEWIRQKRRHITTAGHYRGFHQIALGLYFISQLFFWGLLPFLLMNENYVYFVLYLVLLRFLFWYYRIIGSAKILKEQDLIILAPLLEICLICVQLIIIAANLFSPPKKWQ